MKLISNISDDAIQRHTILLDGKEITLIVRFFSVTAMWSINVNWKGENINGVKLSLGVPHIQSQNWPFDFRVTDGSGDDIDPFQLNDVTSGRCKLFFLEPSDMELIRGFPVEI